MFRMNLYLSHSSADSSYSSRYSYLSASIGLILAAFLAG